MTQLEETLQVLGLPGEISLSGRWARIAGEKCPVYLVEAASATHYYAWCDHPRERAVQVFDNPVTAITKGLERASHPGSA